MYVCVPVHVYNTLYQIPFNKLPSVKHKKERSPKIHTIRAEEVYNLANNSSSDLHAEIPCIYIIIILMLISQTISQSSFVRFATRTKCLIFKLKRFVLLVMYCQ